MLKGMNEFNKIAQDVEDVIKYIESINGKKTDGGEFVPDGNVHTTDESAGFAAKHPEADRAIQHEIYEVDRRIK